MSSPEPSALDAWDYPLPDELVARWPRPDRDGSRLMVLGPNLLEHRSFRDLPDLLQPGDALVVNDTRVMSARLPARRASGARLELLALEPGPGVVACMVRNARRLADGEVIDVAGQPATVVKRLPDGLFAIDLGDAAELMERAGQIPLPPYLGRPAEAIDAERYQTVFAGPLGAAAAPTAGLHFGPELLERLADRGVAVHAVTLHVGIGTFRPLREEDLERGELHPEPWTVSVATAQALARVRADGGRIVAVGTTSCRALESATPEGARSPTAGSGVTRLFVRPGDRLRTVDALITNLHLPRSSLLMLVAAFVGRERLLSAYAQAVREGYRFFSYGDAMFVLP